VEAATRACAVIAQTLLRTLFGQELIPQRWGEPLRLITEVKFLEPHGSRFARDGTK